MEVTRFTSVGRPLNFSHKSNRYLASLLPVLFIIGFVYHFIRFGEFLPAVIDALGITFFLFLTWAINREIDPDYDFSAFLAMGLALFPAFLWENTGFLTLLWTIMLLRIINKSTGLHARLTDSIFIFLFSTAMAYFIDPAFMLFAGLAFLADAVLPPKHKIHVYLAGASIIVFLIFNILRNPVEVSYVFHAFALPVIISCSVLFIPVIFLTRRLKTKGDYSDLMLSASRLRFTGWYSLFLATFITLFQNAEGVIIMLPVWASLAATSIYRYIVLMGR